MIRENPVLGVGLGAYETAYPRYSTQDQPLLVAQSHNDYLQILADGGILGGLIALWFLVAVSRSIWQSCRHTDPLLSAIALGCATGIVSILTHSLFDFNLQIPANALVFLILVAMLSQIASLARESALTQSALAEG
jgi:O-antigen ligase